MNENTGSEFDVNEKSAAPAQYNRNKVPSSESAEESPVMIRRKVKKGYSWASSIILWQQLFAIIFMVICSFAFSAVNSPKIMAEHPDYGSQQVMEEIVRLASTGTFAIISNAVTVILANIISIIIVYFSTKRFKFSQLFAKTDFPVSGIILSIIGVFGVQGLSVIIQGIVMNLTGYSGINEQVSSAATFTDNTAANIILVLYIVILAPILEEIMFRGIALNCLAPVNRTFALIASSLLFGLMHGNFNQIFNGFLLGMVFGYIALKCGSIVPAIICHIFANANAMGISYVFEHMLADKLGDSAYTYELIVFAAELVIGGAAAVILLKRHGKIIPSDIIVTSYTYEFEPSDEKKLTWKLLLKSPVFWIAAAYCIVNACMLITAI